MSKCCCAKWFTKLFGRKKECCGHDHGHEKQAVVESDGKTEIKEEKK